MATREEWQRLIDLSHELALIEDDLREAAAEAHPREAALAQRILFERFGA